MNHLNCYIDHTLLKPTATQEQIEQLCAQAATAKFASVCINPWYVPLAARLLADSEVKVCTVIGFPLGANSTDIKVAETCQAYADGCDEFDMVITVGALKDGKHDYVRDEIAAVVAAAEGRTVKVIIETGLLTDEEKVTAVRLSCEAGAHFVKTCTGFGTGVATAQDVALMRKTAPAQVKVKASAGIRSLADAKAMIEAGADRIGTSAGMTILEEAKQ